jgi:hypothetical protein
MFKTLPTTGPPATWFRSMVKDINKGIDFDRDWLVKELARDCEEFWEPYETEEAADWAGNGKLGLESMVRNIGLYLQFELRVPADLLKPLERLVDALQDAQNGSVHPLLKPRPIESGRPIRSVGGARFMAEAAAIVTRFNKNEGIGIDEAVHRVVRAVSGADLKEQIDLSNKSLKSFRKNIRAQNEHTQDTYDSWVSMFSHVDTEEILQVFINRL